MKNMKNKRFAKLRVHSTSVMLIVMLLLLCGGLLSTAKAPLEADPLTGAIWTTNRNGEWVNGNLYNNPRSVYLGGGPHKIGALGLADGWYCFQVTDPQGAVLSTDDISKRAFEVRYGYIYSVPSGGHASNPNTARGVGIVVQLWPFVYSSKQGGEYKVWVTSVDYYTRLGGFIPSLCKTDNFKVNLAGVTKYFELWVTEGISQLNDVAFFVDYTVDVDGDPLTFDPVSPWTHGQLIFYRNEGSLRVFRDETTFVLGTYIYCQFSVSNAITGAILWASDMHGPELISEGGLVNKETLFKISGHKYDNPEDLNPIEGWAISLSKDGTEIADTLTDNNGYYMFIGAVPGSYTVSCEGWASGTETWYEFEAESGVDQNLDFYGYKMMRMTNLQDTDVQSFQIVFTPTKDGSGLYKMSSTNPGSFHFNTIIYRTPGTPVDMEILLPPDQENGKDYDSPNFILHHEFIGSTSMVDLHIYKRQNGLPTDEITALFTITALNEKDVKILGTMPNDCESILVTVHIDYQISASLTLEEVQSFNDFKYTFTVMVYGSIFGGRTEFEAGAD